MNDKRTPNSFDDLFDDLLEQDIPQPDATQKRQAMQMASAEFEKNSLKQQSFEEQSNINKENYQGNLNIDRRIDNQEAPSNEKSVLMALTNSIRGFFMNTNNNSFAYKAFGTAAVAFLAISMVLILPKEKTEHTLINDFSTISTESNIQDTIEERETIIASSDEVIGLDNFETKQHSLEKTVIEEVAVSGYRSTPSVNADSSADLSFDPTHRSETQAIHQPLTSVSEAIQTEITDSRVISSGLDNSQAKIISSQPTAIDNPSHMLARQREQRLDGHEEYAEFATNPIKLVSEEPVSTFSTDVDTASYSLVRNQLNNGYLPNPQAVRPEEFINYFDYNYPTSKSNLQPFEPTISVIDSPWNTNKKIVHVAIKGYEIEQNQQPDSNLVFLLDVSGSMNAPQKLPSLSMQVPQEQF